MARDGIDTLLRDLGPQVLGAVARRHAEFPDAEDAVQEALFAASTQWPAQGVPDNPRGWLYHVALRRLTDVRRSDGARQEREATIARDTPEVATDMVAIADEYVFDGDDTLLLLFMSCHPSLSPASAVALTLRAVGGLTTREIAAAFLVPEATMAQRISRAKQSIRDSALPFALPGADARDGRLRSVLQVLYLIFNEGYASTSGGDMLRTDLSNEAIRLTRGLQAAHGDVPEIAGLLALMLLTDARRLARTGPAGELVPLDEQDRGRWDRTMIDEGVAVLTRALALGAVGPYQVQAAIAAVHADAPDVIATDWAQILALYDLLVRMQDNPMVHLNRAVAVAMVHGPAAGLRELDELSDDARVTSQHRLTAIRAHLLERGGDLAAAEHQYRDAAAHTASIAERDYLLLKAARVQELVRRQS